jgi:hypothetical protein
LNLDGRVEKVGVERGIVQLARRRELDGVVEYCGGVLVLVVDRGGSEASRWNWRKRADGHGSRSRWRRQGSLDRAYVRRKLGFTYGVSFGI